MHETLKTLDRGLYERYLTLERNIKAKSNSFYDAFLDLQEHLVKLAIEELSLELKAQETCGAILRREEVKAHFTEKLGLDGYTYSKMQDYTLKVNAHKHKGEKTVQLETVLNYLRVFHTAASAYAKGQGISLPPLDTERASSLFGLFERENGALREEAARLKEELSALAEEGRLKENDLLAYKSLLSDAELRALSLEEQNTALYQQISRLKDIKLSSLEDKLNRAIEMLLSLNESVAENRAVSYAVGDTICGSERFREYVERAKKKIGG